jgi:arsenite methyltransferase
MSGGLRFDRRRAARSNPLFDADVVAQRCEVLKALKLPDGERVLPIGSGPGLLAYESADDGAAERRVIP